MLNHPRPTAIRSAWDMAGTSRAWLKPRLSRSATGGGAEIGHGAGAARAAPETSLDGTEDMSTDRAAGAPVGQAARRAVPLALRFAAGLRRVASIRHRMARRVRRLAFGVWRKALGESAPRCSFRLSPNAQR